MSYESIASVISIPAVAPTTLPAVPVTHAEATQGGFGSLVSQGLESVNQQLLSSQNELQELAAGHVQNLHQVMMHLEESSLSFQLMMQVRGRLLEAYQDVMKMQI